MKKGNVKFQVFAICINSKAGEYDPLREILDVIYYFHECVKKTREFTHIKTYSDVERVMESKNRIGCILAIEGGDIFRGQLHIADLLYELGVRLVTLTWNWANSIGAGVWTGNAFSGLTDFGRELVEYLQRKGIIVDISHLSSKCLTDCFKCTSKPIVASHSNCYRICRNSRNLTDAQIRAIAKTGGIVGINFFTKFLTSSKKAGLENVYKHILHVMKTAGEKCVGLGSDFDGVHRTPDNLHNCSYFQELMRYLESKGIRRTQLRKISHGNWLRVLRECL